MKQYPASQNMTGMVIKNLQRLFGTSRFQSSETQLTREKSRVGSCSPYCLNSLVVVVGRNCARGQQWVHLHENRGNCFSSSGLTRPTPRLRSLQRHPLPFARGSARRRMPVHAPCEVFVRNSRSKSPRVRSLLVEPSSLAFHRGRQGSNVVVL